MFKVQELVVEKLPPPRGDLPAEESLKALNVGEVEQLLGAEGPFSESLERYEERSGQLAMTRAVADAFNTSSHLMVEAGTGTGKSLAYLVPSIRWAILNKTPVVVSTNTKNLQSQLFEKDLPLIRRVVGDDFRVALIKGRSNYLCLRKLMYMQEHSDYEIRPSEAGAVESVISWVRKTSCGDLTELGAEDYAVRRIAGSLTSSSEECAGRGCRYYKQCFLQRARAKSMGADVIVANHSLVFAEMGVKGQSLPAYNHLVLDEAHNVEDAATRHFSVEISAGGFRFPLRRLGYSGAKNKKVGKGLLASLSRQVVSGNISGIADEQDKILKLCREASRGVSGVERKLEPFFDVLSGLLKKRSGEVRRLLPEDKSDPVWPEVVNAEQALRAAVSKLNDSVVMLCDALRELDQEGLNFGTEFVRDIGAQRALLADLCDQMAFVLAMDDVDYVYWVEQSGRMGDSARILAAPVAIGERLRDELYELKLSVVFTSATLSVHNSFNFLQERL
jgi:ATP-dependent DNA helicase DinG